MIVGLKGILRVICYNAEFLQKFCSLYPFQTMKTVRLSLNLTERFLNDPLVCFECNTDIRYTYSIKREKTLEIVFHYLKNFKNSLDLV